VGAGVGDDDGAAEIVGSIEMVGTDVGAMVGTDDGAVVGVEVGKPSIHHPLAVSAPSPSALTAPPWVTFQLTS